MKRQPTRQKPEPTIALINIVFLMLIFFMVAGTLSPPLDPQLELVDTRDLEGRAPENALILGADGTLQYRGNAVSSPEPYLTELRDRTVARLMPDRNASATELLTVTRDLRSRGVETVLIVTQKARP
ncbi:MAG: biopolymer transporter ExbD [Pseudomonadota bacterium]